MPTKLQSTAQVELTLEPGKVLGLEEISKLVVLALNNLDVPAEIKPKLNLKADYKEIQDQVAEIQQRINERLDTTTKGTGGFGRVSDTSVKQLQTTLTELDQLASQGRRLAEVPEFKDEEFVRQYKKLYDDGVRDPKTNKLIKASELTTETIERLRQETKDPLFSGDFLRNMEKYNSQAKQIAKQIDKVAAATARLRSQDYKGSLTTQFGKSTGRSLPDLLAAQSERLRRGVAETGQYIHSPAEQGRIDAAQLKIEKAAIRGREREQRQMVRRYDEALKLEAKRQQEVGKLSRADLGGRALYGKLDRGIVGTVTEYKNAITHLRREAQLTEKEMTKLFNKPETKETNEQIRGLTERANQLQLRLKAVGIELDKVTKRRLQPGTLLAPPGGTAIQKRGPDLERNARLIGQEVFERSGGFGAVRSVPKPELEDLASYHKSRIKTLKEERSQLDITTKANRDHYHSLGADLRKHRVDLERTTERMQNFGSGTQQVTSLLRQFFRYALGYGALYKVLQAVRSLTSGVVELEAALKSIQAVTQATAQQMRVIEVGIKGIATETQFNTKEIADAAQILGQAGVIPKELPSALRATALFASATGSAIELSADLVTSMRNVFTTLSDQSIANQLTKAINISKLTAADLKTVISLSSQIAKSYSLTSEQYLAAVTTLRNAGIKPSTVATGLRQGLIEIFSPDSKTVQALKLRYRQLGEELSSADVRDRFFGFSVEDSPLVSALRELQRLGFTGEGKKVFQRAYDVRAENAISALINRLSELEQASSKITFGRAAALGAQTQMESLSLSVKNLSAAISVLAYDAGSPVLGFLEEFADGATKVVKALTDINLKLEELKNFSLGEAGLIGAATGVFGAYLAPGGLPGKLAVGAASAYAGAKLTTDLAGIDKTDNEGQAKSLLQTVWDWAKASLEAAMTILGTVLSVELINVLRRRGSPLLRGIFSGVAGLGRKGKGVAGADLSIISGKAGVISGASAAAEATGVLGFIFGHKIWKTLVSVSLRLKNLLRINPVISAILAVISIATAAYSLLTSREKDSAKSFDSALKRRDRAQAELKKVLDDQEEFKLSGKNYKAKPGTTAATVEKLSKDIEAYEASLNDYFTLTADELNDLTDQLIDLEKTSPAEGAERDEALKKIQDSIGSRSASERLTPEILSRLAGSAEALDQTSEALRLALHDAVNNLVENEEKLDLLSKYQLQAYRELAQEDPAFDALIYGLRTNLPAKVAAKKIFSGAEKLLQRQQELFDASEEGSRLIQEVQEEKINALKKLTGELAKGTNLEQFRKLMRDFGVAWEGFGEGVVGELQSYIDIVDDILRQAKIREDRLRYIQQAKKTVGGDIESAQRGAGKRRVTRARSREDVERLAELKAEEKRLLAEKAANKDAEDQALRLKIEFNRQQQLKISKISDDARIKNEEFINLVTSLAEDFDAEGQNAFKGNLEERYPEGGAAREAIERLRDLSRNPEKLAQLADINPKTGQSTIPEDLLEAAGYVEQIRQAVVERNQAGANIFPEDLTLYRRQRVLERQIKQSKDRDDYSLLTTSDEEKNLYERLKRLRIARISQEINFEKTRSITSDQDEKKRDKRLVDLEMELIDLKEETIEKISKAEVDEANKRLMLFKRSNTRLLTGLRKQFAKAVDSGNLLEANEIDQEIISVKRQQLAFEVELLRAKKASQAEIDEFVAKSEEDLVPAITLPATIRRGFTGVEKRIARDSEPRVYESDEAEGFRKQQGIVTDIDQRNAKRIEQMEKLTEAILDSEELINQIQFNPNLYDDAGEAIEITREKIRELSEELGELRGEMQDESSLANLGAQVTKGFDLGNVSNELDLLDSSIGNLGNTIQEDIVSGIDGIAGGFAEALVAGKGFTDGLREGFANMLQQIAADIIKSQVIKLVSFLFSGLSGGGIVIGTSVQKSAKGGPVEAYAGGGIISGPGTGTSDSIPGVVTDERGVPTQGIAVSDGEGIVTAKAVDGIGEAGLHKINKADSRTLKLLRGVLAGFRNGGVPSSSINVSKLRTGASMAMVSPMRFATGGVVRDLSSMDKSLKASGGSTVNHQFQTNLNVEGEGASGIDPDTLRRLDDGISIKIQSYVEEQLRPGGLLQSARAGAKR